MSAIARNQLHEALEVSKWHEADQLDRRGDVCL